MRPTRGPAFAVPVVALLAMVLTACSSSSDAKLPVYPGDSAGASAPSTTGMTSTPGSSPPTPASSTRAIPGGLATTVAVTRTDLPASIPASARPATAAWFAYWEFLGKALSDPQAPSAVTSVGTVATGSAASEVIGQVSGLKAKGWHTAGALQVSVSKAVVSGATATVCGQIRDISFSADRSNKPQEAIVPRTPVFSGTLVASGPGWRVQRIVRVQAC